MVMKILPPGPQHMNEGCFVFQVVHHDGVSVRHQPDGFMTAGMPVTARGMTRTQRHPPSRPRRHHRHHNKRKENYDDDEEEEEEEEDDVPLEEDSDAAAIYYDLEMGELIAVDKILLSTSNVIVTSTAHRRRQQIQHHQQLGNGSAASNSILEKSVGSGHASSGAAAVGKVSGPVGGGSGGIPTAAGGRTATTVAASGASVIGSGYRGDELLLEEPEGPFMRILRLADHSGWVPAELPTGEVLMKEIPVETGLWGFYVDNYPYGQAVRRHPMDSSELLVTERETAILQPMQKIYCDRKVTHPHTGINYYRLQSTQGWVFDRRISEKEDLEDVLLLLEENMVKVGLFAYRAMLGSMAIRNRTDVSDTSMTRSAVSRGEIVAVDVVRESPYQRGNGPFLRLTDGAGWLFESKLDKKVMEEIPIQRGMWEVRVLNPPVGIALRRHPINSNERFYQAKYAPDELLQCDARLYDTIKCIHYYRVKGTQGWIFDRRDDTRMLEVLSESKSAESSQIRMAASGLRHLDKDQPWTADFVRGIASIVDGLEEISFFARSQVVSFRNQDDVQMNVYYGTRTVGTMIMGSEVASRNDGSLSPNACPTAQVCHRNCTPRDLLRLLRRDFLEIMKVNTEDEFFASERIDNDVDEFANDRDDGGSNVVEEKKESWDGDHHQKTWSAKAKNGAALIMPTAYEIPPLEEDLRVDILMIDARIAELQAQRKKMLIAAKGCDDDRTRQSKVMRDLTMLRLEEMEKTNAERLAKERLLKEQERLLREQECVDTSQREFTETTSVKTKASRPGYVCGECFCVFPGKYSRDLHCREAHGMFCAKCDKIFPSFATLDEHRDLENHW